MGMIEEEETDALHVEIMMQSRRGRQEGGRLDQSQKLKMKAGHKEKKARRGSAAHNISKGHRELKRAHLKQGGLQTKERVKKGRGGCLKRRKQNIETQEDDQAKRAEVAKRTSVFALEG